MAVHCRVHNLHIANVNTSGSYSHVNQDTGLGHALRFSLCKEVFIAAYIAQFSLHYLSCCTWMPMLQLPLALFSCLSLHEERQAFQGCVSCRCRHTDSAALAAAALCHATQSL